MSNELKKVEQIEVEISVIEQSHKSEILSIHENMQQLINDCLSIEIPEDDKEKYDRAVELKRVVKATHVAIDKRKKELKKPLTDYNKRLDKWVDGIYNPLVNAEKIVKQKMEAYEKRQEILKKERKLIEEQQKNEELELENRLKELNSQLEKINLAKNKAQLKEIEIYLDSIVISDFGKKSNEAGFVLNQLKMTCSMASRLMKDEEENPIESPKLQTTPITDDFVNKLKGMSVEPVKKVVIENEIQSGLFEKSVTEEIKVDENIISVGGFVKQEEPKQEEPKQEESNINENGFSEGGFMREEEPKIEEPTFYSKNQEKIKASDEDVISIIDKVSEDVIKDVFSLIIERTSSFLNNAEAFENLDFSEYQELIYSEIKKRLGILLSK
jgi:hypothetical protein